MLFLGLGTGLGSAMIVDGVLEPMELAHLPYKKGRTYEDYVGIRGLKRLGKKKWRQACCGCRQAAQSRARGRLRHPRRRQRQAVEAASCRGEIRRQQQRLPRWLPPVERPAPLVSNLAASPHLRVAASAMRSIARCAAAELTSSSAEATPSC